MIAQLAVPIILLLGIFAIASVALECLTATVAFGSGIAVVVKFFM